MESSDDAVYLGTLVATARRARGMRQEDLAHATGIGTSSIRLIERGLALGPSLFTVIRIFRELEISLSELEKRPAAAT